MMVVMVPPPPGLAPRHASSDNSNHLALIGALNRRTDVVDEGANGDDYDGPGGGPPEWDQAVHNAISRGAGPVAWVMEGHADALKFFEELVTIAKQLADMACASKLAHDALHEWLSEHFQSTHRAPETRTYTAWLRGLEDTFLLRVVGWVSCEEDVQTKGTQLKTDLEALCGWLRETSPADSTAQEFHSRSC